MGVKEKMRMEPYPMPAFWLKRMNTTHCEAPRSVGEKDRKFKAVSHIKLWRAQRNTHAT